MNIAILTPTFFRYSGPDRVVENEAEEYVARGDSVTVFTFKGDIIPKGYRVVELGMPAKPMLERLYRLLFFLDLPNIVKATRLLKEFDQVISFLYPMTILGANANRYYHKQYLYYNVGVAYPHLFPSLAERMYMRLFNFFTNFTVKNATSAISISNFLKEELKRETGLESTVKYVKVEGSIYHPHLSEKRAQQILEKHAVGHPLLLYVGRLSPHKGAHLLLEAFRRVRQKVPAATLLVVGKPTFDAYSKQLQKTSESIGNVVFTGFVAEEDLPFYYAACDVYTTGTLWEGFDIPAVCAQLCGKKVVAFDVGSHPEVVKDGILVQKGDIAAFANAILTILESKKEKKARNKSGKRATTPTKSRKKGKP